MPQHCPTPEAGLIQSVSQARQNARGTQNMSRLTCQNGARTSIRLDVLVLVLDANQAVHLLDDVHERFVPAGNE